MNKHTPGPWRVFLTPSGHQYIEHCPSGKRTEGHQFVAETNMLSPETPSAKFDATLIATAPELLEALKCVVGLLPPGPDAAAEVVCKALAVIAKAEGREE